MTGRTAIVVGAGVIGSATALELSRAGSHVTVLDAGSAPGQGSTSASSAVVRYHYRHIDEAALAWEAGHRWRHWGNYLGVDDPIGMAKFHETGLLLIDGELIDLTEALENLAQLGVVVERLAAPEIRARFPTVDPSRLGPPRLPADEQFWADAQGEGSAYWIPQSGFVDDPTLAAHNLAYAAESNGAIFQFGCRVTAVTKRHGRVAGVVLSDGTEIPADVVVNAAGPWSAQLNELADVLGDFVMSTRPLQQEVVSLPAPERFHLTDGAPCVTDVDLGTYFRPNSGGTMLVGGMEAPCDPLIWLNKPEDVPESVSREIWDVQTLRVARRMPGTGVPNRPKGIVGVYDVTDDWIPIYDKTNLPGFYVAIGTSGHGFKQAPVVGDFMTQLIYACESGHQHDVSPVQVRLSATGRLLNSGHFSRLRNVRAQDAMG
jgi:sarcosine oxidase subunit beta